MYAHTHCINTEKWGQYHNAEGTQGAHSTPKMTASYSPRLYHMSLISKPICLLMSPYLDTRERKMPCQSTEPLEDKLQACIMGGRLCPSSNHICQQRNFKESSRWKPGSSQTTVHCWECTEELCRTPKASCVLQSHGSWAWGSLFSTHAAVSTPRPPRASYPQKQQPPHRKMKP